jgi:nitroreductase
MPIITGKLRQKLKNVRDGARQLSYKAGTHAIHYRLVSGAFNRENEAVFAGVREHYKKVDAGSEVFELRRRIHMVEKGLSMRPRRNTFAAGYINMLLDRLEQALRLGILEDETVAWARDVLDGYFEATSESKDTEIARARERYAVIRLESPLPYCGPAVPVPPAVAFDPEVVSALAHHRRSVRWYLDKPVERSIVDDAITVAVEAPTACNRVPYRFHIFDDPDDATRIASIAGGTVGYVENLQSVVVLVGDLSAYVDERDRHLIYIDGSLAAMGFIYSLEAHGVATCCINWPDLKEPEKEMAEVLGLAPYERVVMLIAYGYADPTGLAPASPKRPLTATRLYSKLD